MNELKVSWIHSYDNSGRPRYSKLHLVIDEGGRSRWDKDKTLCGQPVPSHAGVGELDSGTCKACKRIAAKASK